MKVRNGILGIPQLLILLLLCASLTQAAVDLSFDAGDFYQLGGRLNDVAIESDGDLLFVGFFDRIKESLQSSIVRVSADGIVDVNFAPIVNGSIDQVEIQNDGKVLIAGSFSQINGQSQVGLARLNSDGSLDVTYMPSLSRFANKDALVLDVNGKAILGGAFSSINGQNQSHLARINTDGTLDANFTPSINDDVKAVALQSDGKLIIGGFFTLVNGVTRNKIARLNVDGTLDTTFDPNGGTEILRGITSIDVRADGKIAIAGGYSTLAGVATPPVAVLNSDGSVDNSFDAEIDRFSSEGKVKLLTDDKVLVGGLLGLPFSSPIDGHFVRMDADGSLDESFDPEVDWKVCSFVLDSSGDAILSGLFSESTSNSFSATAKVSSNGDLDTFNVGQLELIASGDDVLMDAELQVDGKIIVGGSFSSIDNITRNNIARLNSDGSVDTLFNASANDDVESLSIQADGKVLISGSISRVNDIAISNLARLNTDGSLDQTFTPNPNCIVRNVLSLNDTNILIAGCFSQVASQAQSGVALLDASGNLVSGFKSDIDIESSVYALNEQPDGKFLLGGEFTQVNGSARSYLARLELDGTLDPTFNPVIDGSVRSIIITTDNKIGIAGFFDNVGGVAHRSLAKLNLNGTVVSAYTPMVALNASDLVEHSDGKVLVGGNILSVNGTNFDDIARINPDGTLDEAFNPMPNSTVSRILVQSDEKVIIVGGFTTISGELRSIIARVEKNLPPQISISPPNIQQSEGDEGVSSFTYTLDRINDIEPEVTLDFSVMGIGVNPADVEDFGGAFPTGSVSFAVNELSKQLVIDVSSDFLLENNEQFSVTLSNPSVGTLGTNSANALIINDDIDDVDDDGIANDGDNCPLDSNSDQTDTDNDDIGDTCDDDDDNDNIDDSVDNCPLVDNANQLDTDGDLTGNACDNDDDNDGVDDNADTNALNPLVCRDLDSDSCDDCSIGVDQFGPSDDFNVANDGVDTDANGQCNLTDPDDDGDAVPDGIDNCPLIANFDQKDENGFEDGEGEGDACELGPEDVCIPIKLINNSVVLICL